MKFYVLALRKSVDIPENKVKEVVKGGRRIAMSVYKKGTKEYKVARILGMADKKKKPKTKK